MNKYQVFFQREEDAVITDAQAVFARLVGQFFHVTLQIVPQRLDALADQPALLLGQLTQLRAGPLRDVQTIVHAPTMAIIDAMENSSNCLKLGRP